MGRPKKEDGPIRPADRERYERIMARAMALKVVRDKSPRNRAKPPLITRHIRRHEAIEKT